MVNENDVNAGQKTVGFKNHNHLDSWKEIATYLNRNVRTVQRWERREGLPVRRHFHGRASSVSACKEEIDAWQKRRSRFSGQCLAKPRELDLVIEKLRTVLLKPFLRDRARA